MFKGAIRLPTVALIPRNVFGIILAICATLWLTLHWYAVALFVFLWTVCYAITKKDDRAFRIIGLWFITKFATTRESIFTGVWGGSSVSPSDNDRGW